jgi:hypothetical protein
MTCAACEKRQAQEQRQLSDCENRCKEINIKNQRLSLALAVVGTLVGKESLDFALGLSSTFGQLAAATSDGSENIPPAEVATSQSQGAKQTVWTNNRSSTASFPSVLFADLPALTPMLIESSDVSFDEPLMFDFFTEQRASIVPVTGVGVLGIAGLSRSRRRN